METLGTAARTVDLDVAVLGGGFSGVYCARALQRKLGNPSTSRVGLISDDNHMVFQPMLPEVVGASLSPRHVVNALRLLCRGVQVLRGEVRRMDFESKRMLLQAGDFVGKIGVRFDHLVLALGSTIDLRRVPGMPEHAFLLRNVGDAMLLRSTIISRVEEASLEHRPEARRRLLSFVVVGGGFSGVETAGHILDLFHSIHSLYPSISEKDFRVFLVHGKDHLLPSLSRRLGQYCERKLEERGLRLVLGQHVKSVTAHRVYLADGDSIDANTVIATIGNAPHPLVQRLACDCGLATDRGFLRTEMTGQVEGETHLWAAGDCAAFPRSQGGSCPRSAQFAMRQGELVGLNIARSLRRQSLKPFTYTGMGEMASIGHHTAVAEVFGMKFSGFPAWWLWRTVYLLKLPSLDRKIRVVLDWTLDLVFPRDINHLSPRYSRLPKAITLQTGDVLVEQNDPVFSSYFVTSGRLELYEDGRRLESLKAGDYLGEESSRLKNGMWRYRARAAEPTELVSVPSTVLRKIVKKRGSLEEFFRASAEPDSSRDPFAGRKSSASVSRRDG